MAKLKIPTDGSAEGVKVLKQGFNVDPLLQKQADCISTMTYNEYWQVIDAGIKPEDLVVFKYEDQGVATLEDGLYVLESNLRTRPWSPSSQVRRGLDEGLGLGAREPGRGGGIVLENDATGAQTEKHQKRMMGEINKLTEGSNGVLDPADYERTVQILLSGGSDPVISKAPTVPGPRRHRRGQAVGRAHCYLGGGPRGGRPRHRPGPRPRRPPAADRPARRAARRQFAGYYVADYQGYYDEAEVAVTINPAARTSRPQAGRRLANLIVERMPVGAGQPRAGRAAGQHRPAVQRLGPGSSPAARTAASRRRPISGRGLGIRDEARSTRSSPAWAKLG